MIDKRLFEFPIVYAGVPGRFAIGWGVHETVADECKAVNIKKALIITTGLKGTGIVDEINKILTINGIATVIFDKVTSNPKDYEVMEAHKVFKEYGCDGVISVGGGSSHDCAKAVRAVVANDGKYVGDMAVGLDPPWMEQMKKSKPVTIPQISVNTTGGTGAELSAGGMITNTKAKAKQLIMVPGICPSVALVDPLLVRLMPQKLVAWTGFDALTHAFESFICRTQSHYNLAIQLRVMKLVAENLREFTYNRMNSLACENMCWAESMALAGVQLGGGVGIVHAMAHGISTLCNSHHGLSNAAVAVPLERYNEPVCPDKFAEMARAMGVDTRGMSKMQASNKWFDEIERLLADLNIKTGHLNEQFGLQKKDLEHIVKFQYEKDFCREGNPREFNFEDCIRLLEDML